jgi:deazaflavin-dependent oxidoreductase (nitroreductase family)
MTKDYQQNSTGAMTYPKKGTWNWLLFKSPLIWWRMGLGQILSHKALGGNKMLALSTWGRKSGKPRHTMLSYVSLDQKEYVCSGWGQKSDWYKNIVENPHVTVHVGRKIYAAKARRVKEFDEYAKVIREMFETGGDSHFEAWLESYGIKFKEQDMLEKRERLYIIVFDPCVSPGPQPIPVNLKWIWGLLAVILIGLWRLIK